MSLLDIVRIAGMILSIFLFARYLRKHPRAFRPLSPRVWISRARSMNRRSWARVVGVGVAFALISFALLPRASTAVEEEIGPVVTDPEQHPVTIIHGIFPAFLLGFAVVMPVFEEWIFRGMILREFLKARGWVVALLVSSAAFAALHVANPGTAPLMFLPAFLAGLLFGVSYLYGGLGASTISHSLYNGIVFFVWWV